MRFSWSFYQDHNILNKCFLDDSEYSFSRPLSKCNVSGMFHKNYIRAICYLLAILIVPLFPTYFSLVCSLVAEKSACWCLIKEAKIPSPHHFSQPRGKQMAGAHPTELYEDTLWILSTYCRENILNIRVSSLQCQWPHQTVLVTSQVVAVSQSSSVASPSPLCILSIFPVNTLLLR